MGSTKQLVYYLCIEKKAYNDICSQIEFSFFPYQKKENIKPVIQSSTKKRHKLGCNNCLTLNLTKV